MDKTGQNLAHLLKAINIMTYDQDITEAIQATKSVINSKLKPYFACEDFNNGKMIRPLLFFLSAKANEADIFKYIPIAASIELIHTASLFHDDIIDEAETRRGLPAVWKISNTKEAILLGDYIWSQAIKLLLENAELDVLKVISSAANDMIMGEIAEQKQKGDFNISRDSYLDMISKKTASLFFATTKCAVLVSNKNALNGFENVGHNFGMAFQIMDDLSDLTSSAKISGKPVNNDAKQKNITLPLILALEKSTDRSQIKVNQLINQTNAIEHTKDIARNYQNNALKNINNNEKFDSLRSFIKSF